MIIHVTIYQLNDQSKKAFVESELSKLKSCPLIEKNIVYSSYFENLPVLEKPVFGDVMHIAYFASESDALSFPGCTHHVELMKMTDQYIKNVMTLDAIDS